MGIACAFGLAALIGIKFNSVVQVLPFLLVGLGMDNAFVIIGSYQVQDPTIEAVEKVALTLKRAGPSIFVTSSTDVIAFALGSWTVLPALQAFCAYASIALFFIAVFQTTVFVAFLALDARREQVGWWLNKKPGALT